jgi:outer membrane lipoprotein-sorting protein
MKKLIALALLALGMTLSGCAAESVEELRKNAEYAKVCEENGGHVNYNMINQMMCSFYKP